MRLSFDLRGEELLAAIEGGSLFFKRSTAYPVARIAELCREFEHIFERGRRLHTLSDEALRALRQLGEALFSALISAEIAAELPTDGPLTLHLDESLLALPWELLHDAKGFWAERFDLGRRVSTAQSGRSSRALPQPPLRMLIVCADARGDLPHVLTEGQAIVQALDRGARINADLLVNPPLDRVRRQLKDYDLVHFAGHVEPCADRPAESGWLFEDGLLSANEILEMGSGRPMPLLVFANACRSSEAQAWQGDNVHGLANAFLRAGVQLYVGTRWEIADAAGATIAAAFYEAVARGASAGMALRVARNAGRRANQLAWAVYLLYGDPELVPLPASLGFGDQKELFAAANLAAGTRQLPRKRSTTGPFEAVEEGYRQLKAPQAPAPVAISAPTRALLWIAGISSLAALLGLGVVLWLLNGRDERGAGSELDKPSLLMEESERRGAVVPKLLLWLPPPLSACLNAALVADRRFERVASDKSGAVPTLGPLSRGRARQLAHATGAELVVYAPDAQSIAVIDALTGEQALTTKALSKGDPSAGGCAAISDEMARIFLGQGHVTASSKGTAEVNLGWRSRVAPGLILTVVRDGKPVGSLTIDRVQLDSCTARGEAKVGDRVHLVR